MSIVKSFALTNLKYNNIEHSTHVPKVHWIFIPTFQRKINKSQPNSQQRKWLTEFLTWLIAAIPSPFRLTDTPAWQPIRTAFWADTILWWCPTAAIWFSGLLRSQCQMTRASMPPPQRTHQNHVLKYNKQILLT